MIKVCHLTSAHKVFDIRIFQKECKSVAATGMTAYLVVTGSESQVKDGVHIVNAGPYAGSRFRRMLISTWKVYRAGLKIDADIYHFHDPELLPYGYLLKRKGKKVVYDVHEDVAADILDKEWIYLGLRKLVAGFFDFFEKRLASLFDGVAVVTEPIAAKFRLARKVILLRNFPVLAMIDSVAGIETRTDDKFVLIYTGMLTRTRGLVPMIDAMQYVAEDIELWLLGSWESEVMHKECRALSGYQKVKYFGNVPQELSIAKVKEANVGMINFLPIPNHIEALPNKPFEYMSCGLPMIMSGFDSWKKMFEGCALFVNPADSKDIAEKVMQLYTTRELARGYGQTGLHRVREKYSWEAESKTLLNLYKEIMVS